MEPQNPLPLVGLAIGTLLAAAYALYHRISRQDVLAHPLRSRIYEFICANPGVRVGAIARHHGVAYKTALAHVLTLHRLGVLDRAGNGHARWFASGRSSPSARKEILATTAPATAAVLALVRARGSMFQIDIQSELGLPKSTVSAATSRLAADGLVQLLPAGRTRQVVAVQRTPPAGSS
ncbi:MAG TPA: MarR family transcriptional regulator [Candidatus Thermoplasmatota archaeon]|nr:MarR family transcriptional regulator [Candidatus Thermoplasmatota archaeon]